MENEKPMSIAPKTKNQWKPIGIILIIVVVALATVATIFVCKNVKLKSEVDDLNTRIEKLEKGEDQEEESDDKADWLTADIGDPINDWKVKYPKDWEWNKDYEKYSDVTKHRYSVFKSPSGKFQVHFFIQNTAWYDEAGVGGEAPMDEFIKNSHIVITNLAKMDASLVEYITESLCISEFYCGDDYMNSIYQHYALLVPGDGSDWENKYFLKEDEEFKYHGSITDIQQDYREVRYLREDECIVAMNTDEYKTAREILLSLE